MPCFSFTPRTQASYFALSFRPTDFVQIASGGWHCLALRADGSIVSWGRNDDRQVSDTPAGGNFAHVAGGWSHSLAIYAPDLSLSVTNLVAGQSVSIQANNATPGGRVFLVYSLVGGGLNRTSWGTARLSPPYIPLSPMTTGGNGTATTSLSVPAGAAGVDVWLQALDWRSLTLSNGLALTVQ